MMSHRNPYETPQADVEDDDSLLVAVAKIQLVLWWSIFVMSVDSISYHILPTQDVGPFDWAGILAFPFAHCFLTDIIIRGR